MSKELEVTPLMLKKHPFCVNTIKRLRHYVGNLKEWDMTETDKILFNLKAQELRNCAVAIYSKFKVNIFN